MKDEPGVYRVWMPNGKTPGLALSRAFGDYCMKDFGLISVPDVTHTKLTTRDQFIILATDGVCVFYIYLLNGIIRFNIVNKTSYATLSNELVFGYFSGVGCCIEPRGSEDCFNNAT